jgi:hypothetical protein
MNPDEMKQCRCCGAEKAFSEFSPSKKNRDGLVSHCKACLRDRGARDRDARRGSPPSCKTARVTPEGMKWCPSCEAFLSVEAFGRNRSTADGRTAYCKPCHNEIGRTNRERRHGSTREYHLRRRYGIGVAEYDNMVEAQGGLCALCREREPEHVDHDHLTGRIRGVLCSCCNQGLGNFRDNVAALKAAIDYLETSTWQKSRICTGVFRLTSPRPARRPSPTSSALQHLISSHRVAVTSPPV